MLHEAATVAVRESRQAVERVLSGDLAQGVKRRSAPPPPVIAPPSPPTAQPVVSSPLPAPPSARPDSAGSDHRSRPLPLTPIERTAVPRPDSAGSDARPPRAPERPQTAQRRPPPIPQPLEAPPPLTVTPPVVVLDGPAAGEETAGPLDALPAVLLNSNNTNDAPHGALVRDILSQREEQPKRTESLPDSSGIRLGKLRKRPSGTALETTAGKLDIDALVTQVQRLVQLTHPLGKAVALARHDLREITQTRQTTQAEIVANRKQLDRAKREEAQLEDPRQAALVDSQIRELTDRTREALVRVRRNDTLIRDLLHPRALQA